MADQIDRGELLLKLDKRKTYEAAEGRNNAYLKGIRDAIKDVKSAPAVEAAVPLIPLCRMLGKIGLPPCNHDRAKCIKCTHNQNSDPNNECWMQYLWDWMKKMEGN